MTDDRDGIIELLGVNSEVKKTADTVNRLLNKFTDASTDLNHIKKTRSRIEYLRAFSCSADITAPEYWRKYRGSLNDKASPHGHLTPLDSKLTRALTELVLKTWQSEKVGQGHDAANLSHRSIQVRNISVIENVSLYKSYVTHMKEFYKQKSSGVPRVKGLQGEYDIDTIVKSNLHFSFIILHLI